MNLEEYLELLSEAQESNWTVHSCWGFSAGPSYLQNISSSISSPEDQHTLEVSSHNMRASFNPNLDIWIAWGYPANPDFRESWANNFPDPSASSAYVDFFYGSNLVYRDIYVSIDGGRCNIPLPRISNNNNEDEDSAKEYLYLSRERSNFFSVFNQLEITCDYTRYLERCSITLTDEPWNG